MREIRIYQPGTYSPNDQIMLSNEAAQHVAVVLRMQVDEQLTLFNGQNTEFDAIITEIRKKNVRVLIKTAREVNRESPLFIHLAPVISKGERMEIIIQKSVELGINRITPLISERCVVKLDAERLEKKRNQWQAIAIAACEQCGRNSIPTVEPVEHLSHFASHVNLQEKFFLKPGAALTWRDLIKKEVAKLALVIGPEGGFAPHESVFLEQQQFTALALGPRILRTETAAITAVSVLQAIYGDL